MGAWFLGARFWRPMIGPAPPAPFTRVYRGLQWLAWTSTLGALVPFVALAAFAFLVLPLALAFTVIGVPFFLWVFGILFGILLVFLAPLYALGVWSRNRLARGPPTRTAARAVAVLCLVMAVWLVVATVVGQAHDRHGVNLALVWAIPVAAGLVGAAARLVASRAT